MILPGRSTAVPENAPGGFYPFHQRPGAWTYGQPGPAGNEGGDPYGYTGEWWESYLNLLFLRARYYAPETGIFLSRDPVESEPGYAYVRGNPVSQVDPSGRTPCPRGTCGPDITYWFMQEVGNHYEYGIQVGAMMFNATLQTLNPSNWHFGLSALGPPMLRELQPIGRPFDAIIEDGIVDEIINNYHLPIGQGGILRLELLRLVEFGLYGLAVDYSNVDFYDIGEFPRNGNTCGDDFCRVGRVLEQQHNTVTLCGKCIDQSDLGNIMFGVGGKVRGYSETQTYVLAAGFNIGIDTLKPLGKWEFNDVSWPFNEDPNAARAGWGIANAAAAYGSKDSFCGILAAYDSKYGIHEDAQSAQYCAPCGDQILFDKGHRPPNSLETISTRFREDRGGTFTWFRDFLGF